MNTLTHNSQVHIPITTNTGSNLEENTRPVRSIW